MEYKDKQRIVADAWFTVKVQESWSDILKGGDFAFPLAHGAEIGFCTLSDEAKKFVEELYDVLLIALRLPNDEEYKDWEAMTVKGFEIRGLDVEDYR